MILEFNQIGRQPDPVFEGSIGGNKVIEGRGMTRSEDAYILYKGRKITISSKIHRENMDGCKVTQVSDIVEGMERIGYIYPGVVAQKKILFISWGYGFFEFKFEDTVYKFYEVGLGENQHFICVYKNDETVAIIHKSDIKINYRDKYTIYSLDDSLLLPMSVCALYVDCIMYPDHGEITGASEIDDSCLTVQKELNEKYDPTFIPRVKAMHGIED